MNQLAQTLSIEQAFYGSFSGHHDFRILAASGGLGRAEREAIAYHSNLGGSALRADAPPPLYSFYELDRRRRRWAFSCTVFLGRESRGNDYLAHILVLDSEVLGVLRGDPFILEDLDLLKNEKPTEELTLPVLPLAVHEAERLSGRQIGKGLNGLLREHLSGVLRGLSQKSVALQIKDGREGLTLCKSVLSLLPPSDRIGLSFCTRFTLPRTANFRLAAFVSEDVSLAERYIVGFDPKAAELSQNSAHDVYDDWMAELDQGASPIFGISLLERPDEAVRAIKALRAWQVWSEDRTGPALEEKSLKAGHLILTLAGDERNQRLEQISRLQVDASILQVNQWVEEALQGQEKPLSSLAKVCEIVRQRDPEGKAVAQILLGAERHFRETRLSLKEATVIFVLALLTSKRAQLDRIYDPKGGRALLRNREEAAKWLLTLHKENPRTCLELVTVWFTHWRLEEGCGLLTEAASILEELARNKGEPKVAAAVRTGLAALEGSAPPAESKQERNAWFLGLLTEVRLRLKTFFPGPLVARMALQENLLEELLSRLSVEDQDELLPLLASSFPQGLAESLQKGSVPKSILPALLQTCQDGLLGRTVGGQTWDVYRDPVYWELVAQVTFCATSAASRESDQYMFEKVIWLLWVASRLISKFRRGGSPEANDLLTKALDDIIKACPKGGMDMALRVVYRFVLCGWDFSLSADRKHLLQFRHQALRDGQQRQSGKTFYYGTLMRVAYLDTMLFKRA